MKHKTQHILFKSAAILLLLVVLFPSAVKFTHVFENHKHEVCSNPSDSHFHEIEIDCEFYKFKLNNTFSLVLNDVIIPNIKNNHKNIISQYFYINSYRSLGIALRGPPSSFI